MLKKIILSLFYGCFFISNSLIAEFITTTDGVKIYYEVAGEGTPLLLIHGGDTNIRREPESESDFKASTSWDAQFQEFSKKYKVIRFDIRGFGQSSLKGTHPINSWEWFENEDRSVTDIMELLKVLNIEKTDVVGLSIGSALAAQLAVYNPKVINKLILVSPWLEHTFSFALPEQQAYLNNFKDKTLLILGENDFFSKKEANKAKDNDYDPKRMVIKGGEHFINSDQPEKFNQLVLDFFGTSEDSFLNFSQENKILELYSAYFNRAADAKGFNFWKKSFRIYLSKITTPSTDTEKENLALQKITSDMATSTEYRTLYPASQSSVDFINAIYINLLGRKSDAGGLAFWSKHIDKGTMSKEQAILNIIAGAKANSTTQGVADGLLIINKTSISKYFSKTLRSNNLKLAKIAFSNITNHSSSVITMRATLDLAIRNPTGNENISNTNITNNNTNTSSSTNSNTNTNTNNNTNTGSSNTNTNNNTNTTVNNTPEGEVIISGIAKEDEKITASNTLTDADGLGTITYQWKANDIDIGTGETYILTSLEVDKTITVTASYTDQKNTNESVISDATIPVEAFINSNTNNTPKGEVVISGIAKEDEMLTASNTLTDADGLGIITYQWKADSIDIGTGDTYLLTPLVVGKTITVTASYTDQKDTDESVISDATMPVEAFINSNTNNTPEGEVIISGTIKEDEILTASNTLTDADGLGTITYQWKADGIDIGTGDTYLLTSLEVGKTITVTASYTDQKNTDESVISDATMPVEVMIFQIIEIIDKETDLGAIVHDDEGSLIYYHGPKDENSKLTFVEKITIVDPANGKPITFDFNKDYLLDKISIPGEDDIYIDNKSLDIPKEIKNSCDTLIDPSVIKGLAKLLNTLERTHDITTILKGVATKEILKRAMKVLRKIEKSKNFKKLKIEVLKEGDKVKINVLGKARNSLIKKGITPLTEDQVADISVGCFPVAFDPVGCGLQLFKHIGLPVLEGLKQGDINGLGTEECKKPIPIEKYECQSRISSTYDIPKMDRHSVFSICEVNITTRQDETDFNKYFNTSSIQENICMDGGIYAIFAQKEIDSFYHEQLFFCAGKRVVFNIGFDSERYFKETESGYQDYVVVDKTTYDYRIMRNIISDLNSPSKFEALSDSCQGFSSRIESIYNNVTKQEHTYIGDMILTTLYEKPGNRCQSTTPIPSNKGEILGQNSKMHITYKFNENKHKIGTWDITGKAALYLKHLPFPGDVCQNTLSAGKQEKNLVQFDDVTDGKLASALFFDVDKIRFYFYWHTTRRAACSPDISSLLMNGTLPSANIKFTTKVKYYDSFHMHNMVNKLLKQ